MRANTLPYWLCQLSGAAPPGSGPVPRVIAAAWCGVAIGTILSLCAIAGEAIAHASAMAPATDLAIACTAPGPSNRPGFILVSFVF
ncbi:hypothetical protein GCM10007386_18970 [Pseudoduganella dura]|nr:hypothetical protein GCM10007386_18970 [Pseudoduganella dura]